MVGMSECQECEYCDMAKLNPLCVYYTHNCPQCDARALAHSPEYWDAVRAEAITPDYRSALQQAFGGDWQDAHVRVKGFAALISAAKREKK